ncbi:thiamine pyrophosphate-binding protein [Butyrivibrio sp. VCD2006]|uniref:thiamine pyrophosphate-binding protein n=1 Tax=Butyrivibrio sp. VCD2006 TaxID=1280664 RepID=UPI00041E81AD|nr:thiamine pyrophosphate-binding protein [Butyrivibrio sp. VCD2006]
MRLADYVIKTLENEGVKHAFMLSGGGIMYLVDALGRSNIKYVCCHHEQAAGIAAQAYGMKNGKLGVCFITTGPGGTNALTPLGAAFTDSTPMIFISGQVKRADFASLRGVRQFGAQENDIVAMAKPVSKYAVTVMEPEKIRYHMEKAIYVATHGRKGPVWIDIPLDVQNAEIDPEKLDGFKPEEMEEVSHDDNILPKEVIMITGKNVDESSVKKAACELVSDLKNYKRPLFIIGHGLVADGAEELFLKVNEKIKAPVIATWRALDVMDYDDPYFFGSPGLQAPRYSNIINQSADLLIVLGSRLDNMITAFSENHFAFRAKKYLVDIDENEMDKLDMPDKVKVVARVEDFLKALDKELDTVSDYTKWLAFCNDMKNRFPILEEKQIKELPGVDLYEFSIKLSEKCTKSDTIVISSTSRCNTAGHMAFKHKKGQKAISSMAYGSMGFALPSVVGAYFASGEKRVICIEGDGSLQLNIQEFQTIVHHKMNAKIFIFHNVGYAAISTMQDRNFDGFHVGCDEDSGVSMPNLKKLSEAYGIDYFRVSENSEIDEVLDKVMETDGPVVCEFFGSILYDEIPKCISSLDENGKRVSAVLENPFPFLSEDEMKEIESLL